MTNGPTRLLSLEEALKIARPRWQIELLFKLWKSQGRIDKSTSAKPHRVLCELCAKLVAMIIQHSVVLVGGWERVDRSLVKMAQTVRKFAWGLAMAEGRSAAIRRIITELRTIFGSCCRVDRRRKHPATCHRLLNLGCKGLTRCEWVYGRRDPRDCCTRPPIFVSRGGPLVTRFAGVVAGRASGR